MKMIQPVITCTKLVLLYILSILAIATHIASYYIRTYTAT